jgi:hypothetical protein
LVGPKFKSRKTCFITGGWTFVTTQNKGSCYTLIKVSSIVVVKKRYNVTVICTCLYRIKLKINRNDKSGISESRNVMFVDFISGCTSRRSQSMRIEPLYCGCEESLHLYLALTTRKVKSYTCSTSESLNANTPTNYKSHFNMQIVDFISGCTSRSTTCVAIMRIELQLQTKQYYKSKFSCSRLITAI